MRALSLVMQTDENPALINTRAARKLTATTCCACHTPLSDSNSVEIGIGPDCRRKTRKEDVGQPADWDRVADALSRFSALNATDDDARMLAERAMANLEGSRLYGSDGLGAQKLCNMVTHYVAAVQYTATNVADLIAAIEAMGRPALAAKIANHRYAIRIQMISSDMLVYSPYNETFRTAIWESRAGRWDRAVKAFRVPVSCAGKLHRALRRAYPGAVAMGSAGTEFRIAG